MTAIPKRTPIAPKSAAAGENTAKLFRENTLSKRIGHKGDLIVTLTEADLGQDRGKRPCLMICHKNNTKRKVFYGLEDVWRILEHKSFNQIASQMAVILYGYPANATPSRGDTFKVIDAMFDFADDLVKAMPPTEVDGQAWLEAVARDGFTLRYNGEAIN
jgi:hypothetical protein